MKHSGIKVEVETKEKGYRVTRSKTFFYHYDKGLLLSLADEISLWTKGKGEKTITIMGIGTSDNWTQETLFRIILADGYDGIARRDIIYWRDSTNGTGDIYEYGNEVKIFQDRIRRELMEVGNILTDD